MNFHKRLIPVAIMMATNEEMPRKADGGDKHVKVHCKMAKRERGVWRREPARTQAWWRGSARACARRRGCARNCARLRTGFEAQCEKLGHLPLASCDTPTIQSPVTPSPPLRASGSGSSIFKSAESVEVVASWLRHPGCSGSNLWSQLSLPYWFRRTFSCPSLLGFRIVRGYYSRSAAIAEGPDNPLLRSFSFPIPSQRLLFAFCQATALIERSFGVWKKKWAILRDMSSYRFDKQVSIVLAMMTLHNFIRRHPSHVNIDFSECEQRSRDHGMTSQGRQEACTDTAGVVEEMITLLQPDGQGDATTPRSYSQTISPDTQPPADALGLRRALLLQYPSSSTSLSSGSSPSPQGFDGLLRISSRSPATFAQPSTPRASTSLYCSVQPLSPSSSIKALSLSLSESKLSPDIISATTIDHFLPLFSLAQSSVTSGPLIPKLRSRSEGTHEHWITIIDVGTEKPVQMDHFAYKNLSDGAGCAVVLDGYEMPILGETVRRDQKEIITLRMVKSSDDVHRDVLSALRVIIAFWSWWTVSPNWRGQRWWRGLPIGKEGVDVADGDLELREGGVDAIDAVRESFDGGRSVLLARHAAGLEHSQIEGWEGRGSQWMAHPWPKIDCRRQVSCELNGGEERNFRNRCGSSRNDGAEKMLRQKGNAIRQGKARELRCFREKHESKLCRVE
ncbi:hypothetical protein KSP39_PZI023956 [Platanthera zijinensis]|uniref:DDE Tnp4 domain-containing protein n=1 Tax=Platanthera zijinensis TaxID=2320716 RepID=A0AAP0AUH1_9ASPA